jgi:hypothetical protein
MEVILLHETGPVALKEETGSLGHVPGSKGWMSENIPSKQAGACQEAHGMVESVCVES